MTVEAETLERKVGELEGKLKESEDKFIKTKSRNLVLEKVFEKNEELNAEIKRLKKENDGLVDYLQKNMVNIHPNLDRKRAIEQAKSEEHQRLREMIKHLPIEDNILGGSHYSHGYYRALQKVLELLNKKEVA